MRRFAGTASHAQKLDHVRVAHLTDLHVGRVTPMMIQYKAAELANQADADLVVITGDFVCHSQAYVDQLADVVSRIDAPVIAVLGNHDYWSGAGEVERALKRGGAEVLKNQWTTFSVRDQSLQVVGLDDAYTGHADRREATKGLSDKVATLGLSHIGEEADALWAAGVPLVLSGHTHAGQVTLANVNEFSVGKIAGHRYVHGLYGARDERDPKGAVYVGAGVGAAVIPLRVGDRGRRELAIFELGHEALDHEHHREQKPHTGRKPSARRKAKRSRAAATKATRRSRTRSGSEPSD